MALAAVTSGFSAVAGCMGLFPSRPEGDLGGGASGREEPITTSATATESGITESPSGEESPTSRERTSDDSNETRSGSSVSLESCPSSLVENVDVKQVICDGERTNAEIFLSTDSGTVSLPSGSIDFTLRNLTGSSQLYIPCRWTVYKQTNGGCKPVKPLEGDTVEKTMFGGSETLTLYIGREPPTDTGKCAPYSLDKLASGRYLFGVQVFGGGGTLALASFRVT